MVDIIGKDLDNGKLPIGVFLNISKAFDTLNRTILLDKLLYYILLLLFTLQDIKITRDYVQIKTIFYPKIYWESYMTAYFCPIYNNAYCHGVLNQIEYSIYKKRAVRIIPCSKYNAHTEANT